MSHDPEPVYDKDSVETVLRNLGAREYRKTASIRAARVDGAFVVDTSEGQLRCEDGYLAIDARGYPYPIAADEFEQIYELVE